MNIIDKDNSIPVYQQIAEDLKRQVLSRQYKDGDKLPSENSLIHIYKVSRTTIQRSLSILVNEGLVERIHGKGTYVRIRSIQENIWNFSGFTDYAKRANKTPVTKVIEHQIVEKNGISCLKLVRLRGFMRQDSPQWITLDTSILSLEKFPGIETFDFANVSLYTTLKEKYETYPQYAKLNVKAILPDDRLVELCEIKVKEPLLKVSGNVYDGQDKIVEQVDAVYSNEAKYNMVVTI